MKCVSLSKLWLNVVVGVLLAVSILVAAPATVTAQEPVVISGFCPFDVQIDFLVNKQKTLEKKGGILITTGALKVRLTGLSSGATLELNVSGPGRVIPQEDGSIQIFTGPWILGLPEGVLPDFAPRLFFSRGRVVAEADAAGDFTSLAIHGKIVDLCAALAD
jgi:hypothetical protein